MCVPLLLLVHFFCKTSDTCLAVWHTARRSSTVKVKYRTSCTDVYINCCMLHYEVNSVQQYLELGQLSLPRTVKIRQHTDSNNCQG